MREVSRVNLIVETDYKFTQEVAKAVVDGVFDVLRYFKKMEQVHIWFESGYEEDEDEDDTEAKRAREYVQKIVEKARELEKIKNFSVCWCYSGGGERKYS
jgi:hypothetical protein